MGEASPADTAWKDFWASKARSPKAANGGGCLPQGHAIIEEAQKSAWIGFAAKLPRNARVLDLATGDGCVLKWMLGRRRDLKLTGVDLAPTLPPPPSGCRTKGGVAMEHLPFPDHRFDAVTSQFGLEYGDIAGAAREIARVLKPSGSVALLVHRGDGPILAHNLARRDQIAWAVEEQDVLGQARVAVTLGAGNVQTALARVSAVAREAASQFGQSSPAWEIAEAARRTLAAGARAGARYMLDTFSAIEAQARNEMVRISSLEQACRAADDREALRAAFGGQGLEQQSCEAVREQSGRAFADFILLR